MAARAGTESVRRASGCVTALLRKQPFFGSLALRLPLRADAGRATLAADGREIRYSPRWIAETDAHVIEAAIARVVLACALKHHTRRNERDPERWQMASQLVTHALLRDAGFTLPPEAEAWDEAMHQALSLAKAEGRVPGGVEETVRDAHASRLDWRTLLRRYMTDAAKTDYSWSLPARRFIDAGLYLPSIRSEGIGTVAVIVDTSGSLPTDMLASFWSELRGIAAELQPESVVVLQVDAAVQDAAEYSAADLPDGIAVKGRGGTDFRPGFAWLDEQGVRPAVCLYFTDMACSRYPETEPDYPVLWVNHADPPSDRTREPWGERIDIGSP